MPAPPGPPQRVAFDGERSTIKPGEPRRGSTVQVSLAEARLVDARGTTVATGGGTAGCDLTYAAGGRGARPTRVRVPGSWSAGRLRCAWKVPRRGALARTIATKNVQLSVAPWILRAGKRYWARDGNHVLYILGLSRR